MSFEGKVAIVTGATSGIGLATARALSRRGASLVLVGRNEGALAELERSLTGDGFPVTACAADVTAADAPDRIVGAAVTAFGGIDILVNAAGVIATGTIETTDDAVWDQMMAVNLRAPFRLIRAAAPHLKTRKGAVVTVSSVNGLRSFPGVLAYCVSKSGADQLTRCAALELAPHGVRVNGVNPGVTVTNLHRRGGMNETHTLRSLNARRRRIPWGVLALPKKWPR